MKLTIQAKRTPKAYYLLIQREGVTNPLPRFEESIFARKNGTVSQHTAETVENVRKDGFESSRIALKDGSYSVLLGVSLIARIVD